MSIYPRVNYEMTEADCEELLNSMLPEPVMKIGSHWSGMDQQERANAAWKRLGDKMGFDHMTVQPGRGGNRFFSAVPNETEIQRNEREAKERAEKRAAEVLRLEKEISDCTAKLKELNEVKP